MNARTEQEVRRSFVNCSRGEAASLTMPPGFAELDWSTLELLGWRDPKAPLRGYLVLERDGRTTGIALRAADTRMSSRTAAMCLLCQMAQTGDAVSLFTARRVGAAGRNGDTVGTYNCADLGCVSRARTEIPPWLQDRDPAEVGEQRVSELHDRVHRFVDAVLRGADV
jgi:hypothetical protein